MHEVCYHAAMLSHEDMIAFVGDRATPEKEAEIRKQFEAPSSFASRFIDEWVRQARDAYNVNWMRLAGLEKTHVQKPEEGETKK